MDSKIPEVSIIILNWNQPELTVNCVKSVLQQDKQDFEIILIDNGSEDNSAEILEKEFQGNPIINLVRHEKNLGYAGGNNAGARLAKGKYVVILNNDTIVEKNWLNELLKAINSDENTAIVKSKVFEGDKKDVDLGMLYWTPSILGYGVLAPHEKKKYFETSHATGCSLMYKKDIVGIPFDDDYFIYAEDTYLSWLTRLKGYKIRTAIDSVVHHHHNAVKRSNPKMAKYFIFLGERNKILNYMIFYSWKTLIKVMPITLTGIGMINVYEPKKIPQRLKSYFWLAIHPLWVWKKRKFVQSKRKVSDNEILRLMSYKIFDEKRVSNSKAKPMLNIINRVSGIYCRVTGIKTIEAEKF